MLHQKEKPSTSPLPKCSKPCRNALGVHNRAWSYSQAMQGPRHLWALETKNRAGKLVQMLGLKCWEHILTPLADISHFGLYLVHEIESITQYQHLEACYQSYSMVPALLHKTHAHKSSLKSQVSTPDTLYHLSANLDGSTIVSNYLQPGQGNWHPNKDFPFDSTSEKTHKVAVNT